MRVIAGTAGGLRLKTRNSEDTKPTLDRVKEAMFSMLAPYLNEAAVLDLFAGSGALGIEALSRGAKSCAFSDRNKMCCDIIQQNLTHTGLSGKASLLSMEFTGALKLLAEQSGQFDLVLLDPPYNKGFEQQAMELLAKYGLCAQGALVAVERAASVRLPQTVGPFTLLKEKKYGTVGLSIYEKKV